MLVCRVGTDLFAFRDAVRALHGEPGRCRPDQAARGRVGGRRADLPTVPARTSTYDGRVPASTTGRLTAPPQRTSIRYPLLVAGTDGVRRAAGDGTPVSTLRRTSRSPLGHAAPDQRQPPGPGPPTSAARCAPPRSADEHPHVVDLQSRSLMCTCRPCYLLFTDQDGRPALPRRARPLPVPPRAPARARRDWDELQIPVGLAFLFRNSVQDRMVAFYPARPAPPSPSCRWRPGTGSSRPTRRSRPCGPTSRRCWCAAAAATDGFTCHVVPIDACYELVGRLRTTLARLRRRQEAREALDAFFASVARAQPAARGRHGRCDERLALHRARHRRRAVRRRPAADRPAAHRRDHRAAGARHRAALPGAHRAAAPPLRRRRASTGCAACSASGTAGRDTLRPFQWMQCNTTVQGFTGSTEVDLALPCTYDFDVIGSRYLHALGAGTVPAHAAVQRHGVHPRRDRLRGAAGAVGQRGALRPAGRGVAAR